MGLGRGGDLLGRPGRHPPPRRLVRGAEPACQGADRLPAPRPGVRARPRRHRRAGPASYPRPSKKLIVEPWCEEEMVVACLPDHPLANREPLPLALLAGEKFVAFDQGLTIRREIDRFLRRHGITVEVVLEFDNIEKHQEGDRDLCRPGPAARADASPRGTGRCPSRPALRGLPADAAAGHHPPAAPSPRHCCCWVRPAADQRGQPTPRRLTARERTAKSAARRTPC